MYMSGIEIIPGGPTLPLPLIEALEAERLIFFAAQASLLVQACPTSAA